MKLLRSEKVRSVLVAVGAIGAVFWAALNTQPSFASNLSLTLTVNGGSNAISLDIVPLSSNGTFRTSDTTTNNILVSTNNYTGYTLGIMAKVDGSTALINQSDNTKTLPSITATVSPTNYADDTYAETNHLNNTWGYRPSTLYDAVNDTNVVNTDYLPAPTSTETSNQTILAKTSSANTTNQSNGELIPDNYNIAIGSRIDSSTPPGEYTNTFVITAVANAITYNINYNANDGNNGQSTTNMPSPNPAQVAIDANTPTITLSNNKPVRAGYLFKGWCTVQEQDNATTCSGNEYRPGTELPVDYTTNTITLYARWIDATLWNAVVDEWELGGSRIQTNDTNVNTGIKASINKANSGVFKYNSDVFGTATDMSNDYDIYYFRGILDNTLGTYGSDGDGEAWPNYVLLDLNNNGTKDTTDTCWRIVRTTASGGTKMIYGGKWTGTSCANAVGSAHLISKAFNDTNSISNSSIIAVGYTFNSAYKTTTDDTPYGTLFGTNSNYSGNTTDSTIKDYIENTWFNSTSGVSAYESILEPNAGYCNDRSIYGIGDNDDIVTPYTTATSGVTVYYFGANRRNASTAQSPSLTCPRDEADVYTIKTTDSDMVETYGGNGQLKYPVALLTADEISFAGSGKSSDDGSSYHANSYLHSGSNFWLISPYNRRVSGGASESVLNLNGYLDGMGVSSTRGIRPAISLVSGTVYSSGSGTAVDPWVVDAPLESGSSDPDSAHDSG